MTRWQHVVPSGLVALVGLWACWISYTQEPAAAFLFPRLISTVFAVLALWTFGKAVMGLSKVGDGVSFPMLRNMAPGLALLLVYVFWAAPTLGFYTASGAAFFILYSVYDPAPHDAVRSWGKRIGGTAVFVAVMYGLFAMVLNVFTPPEILFG